MRKILFRGKRKEDNVWVFGFFRINSYWNSPIIESDSCYPWDVNLETVGQYIGKNDCDGKEIFEGDILGCMNAKDDLGVVK